MKTIVTIATTVALSLAGTGFALAESHHGHGAQATAEVEAAPMGGQAGMMQDMMRMMMKMHAKMMCDNMAAIGTGGGLAMMDGDVIRMMMGPDTMGEHMMGTPAPDAARSAMLARLAEFDADGDGSLSLAEFETLHAALIRETTVDRFQHLDADGDGRITETEMAAPARRMGMEGMMEGKEASGN